MKQFYTKILFVVSLMLTGFVPAQSYKIDASGGGTCPYPDIAATHSPGVDSNPYVLGTFTDTNGEGVELSGLSLSSFSFTSGTCEFYINGTSIGTITESGRSSSCTAPHLLGSTLLLSSVTADIKKAYNIGGLNTLSAKRISGEPRHYFYGVFVNVSTQVLGVEDSEYAGVEVFPNPASDFLSVTGLKSAKRFNIYDILGKNVLNGEVFNHQTIDVRGLQKGLYFLRFPDGGVFDQIHKTMI